MSTKYILHGGNAQDKNNENASFFRQILSGYPDSANILLVQFAAIPEKQEIYKQRHISQFEDIRDGRNFAYELANETDFVEQVRWADVVYLCGASGGGATARLIHVMSKFKNLNELFDNKTVAGESAGANCLSRFCYSKSSGVIEGLGLVPVNIANHFEQIEDKISQQ